MFSIICIILVYLCQISEASSTNTSVEKYYDQILLSLNASQFNLTTLNLLLKRLQLDNCSVPNIEKRGCGNKCLTARYLYKAYGWNTSVVISSRLLLELSSALLNFLLPEKNAGQYATIKNCQNGGFRRDASYRQFLRYYETNGLICERLLDRILQDVNSTFKDSVAKSCFSAEDIFSEMNISHKNGGLDAEDFSLVGVGIISHLLSGDCIMASKKSHDLELPCKSYFSSNLVARFGDSGGHISVHGFEEILKDFGIGKLKEDNDQTDHDHHSDNTHDDHRKRRDTDSVHNSQNTNLSKKCYSSHQLLDIFSVDEKVGLDTESLEEICPALVQQFVSKSCVEELKKASAGYKYPGKYVWAYGFTAVLVISLLSLAGIAVIPTMKGSVYKKIIIVLVGLAIGTLSGDALLHLIPHAAGFHASSHGHDSDHADEGKAFIWKFLVVASGVYGFFLFETFTHLFLQSGGHGHSHIIEHTRKHSPFERNNSCRTVERHEMRFARNPENTENPQVILNKASANLDEKGVKLQQHDDQPDDNLPNLLRQSSDGNRKRISSVGWMIIIGDTIHNITDGIAIGAAFSEDLGGGLSTSVAVFCHELPHELGDFAVLISSGMTVKQAIFANFFSACSSFIGLVIGILIGENTDQGNQWVFAIMGGMFLYIALVDMLPELMHSEELGGGGRFQTFILQNLGMLSGFVIMFFIAFYEEDLVLPV